jgi:Flp pilus assembly CpaE family ATPase
MKPIVVFAGVDGKAGTTMIAQSVAEWITEHLEDRSVLLLSLHGRPGTNYIDQKTPCLDEIRIPLENNLLNKQDLIAASKRNKKLYQIGGVASLLDRRRFSVDIVSRLLRLLKDDFDLIIIDAGNEMDDGLTIGALQNASCFFCIVAQQESYLDQFTVLADIYKQLEVEVSSIIVNQFEPKDSYGLPYIAKRLDIDPTSLIPVMADRNGRMAEKKKQTLLHCGEKQYSLDIATVAMSVLEHCGISQEPAKRRKGWKSFI